MLSKTHILERRLLNVNLGIKAWFIVAVLLTAVNAVAAYVEPTTKTNVNVVGPLFERTISDYTGFEQTLESQKSSAVKGAESNSGFNDLVGSKDAASKASELSNIKPGELENAGIRESAKENWIDNYLLDYSKPGMIEHKKDAELIAEGTGKKLQELVGLLKKLDVDCRQIKGNKEVEPQYFIDVKTKQQEDTVYNSSTDIQQRQQRDTIYNKKICEQLRNQYDCRDQLIVRCLDFAEQPAKFEITSSSIPYRAIPNGSITSYEFSNRGNIGGTSTVGGGIRRGGFGNNALRAIGLGVNRGSTTTLSASTVGVSFSFNIKIPAATVGRLEIVNLQFTSVVQIKINGSNVVVAPGGGYTLDMAGYHEEVRKGKRKYGGVCGGRVKHRTLCPIVTTGSTTHILGKINANNSWGRVDLLPHLRDGGNTVEVKVIGLDQAFVSFVLNTSERICRNWHKEWDEICRIR